MKILQGLTQSLGIDPPTRMKAFGFPGNIKFSRVLSFDGIDLPFRIKKKQAISFSRRKQFLWKSLCPEYLIPLKQTGGSSAVHFQS